MGTENTQFGLVESGANAILNSPVIENLIHDLNLEPLTPKKESRRRFFYETEKQKPTQIPVNLIDVLRFFWGLLFVPLRPRKKIKNIPSEELDRNLWIFSRRIFGKGFSRKILAPAMRGIYATELWNMDPKAVFSRLPLDSNLPIFWALLVEKGRKGKGNISPGKAKDSRPKVRGSLSFRFGMQELTDALVEELKVSERNGTTQFIRKTKLSLNEMKEFPSPNSIINIRLCIPLAELKNWITEYQNFWFQSNRKSDSTPEGDHRSKTNSDPSLAFANQAKSLTIKNIFWKFLSSVPKRLQQELISISENLKIQSVCSITRFSKEQILPKPGFGILFPPNRRYRVLGVLANDSIFLNRIANKNSKNKNEKETISDIHSETWIYAGSEDKWNSPGRKFSEENIQDRLEEEREAFLGYPSSPKSYHKTLWKNILPIYNKSLFQFNDLLDELENRSPILLRDEILGEQREILIHFEFFGNYRRGISLRKIAEAAAEKENYPLSN